MGQEERTTNDVRQMWYEAAVLATEVMDAHLVPVIMQPITCQHSGDVEFNIAIYTHDYTLWAEGNHETKESLRRCLQIYKDKHWPKVQEKADGDQRQNREPLG